MKITRKTARILFILLIVFAVGGVTGFLIWQNSANVVDATNAPATNTSGLPTSPDKPVERPKPLASDTADHLWIPDRSIDTPVVYVEEADEKIFQEELANGVVHYPGTALPGEPGNPYIFGHSSDYRWKPGNYKQVFKPLVDIPVGTVIRITNHAGELFVYKVIETKIVGPKDTSVLDQRNYEKTLLTLQTSWPVGTALKRFIAIAELDEIATYGQ